MPKRPSPRRLTVFAAASLCAGSVSAGGIPADDLEEVLIHGIRGGLVGAPLSATEGLITASQLETRPLLRPGDVLEAVPGLIVTQHGGDGKANQFFLRGFNLDHGSDFATRIDGMPVNLPSHAHGQGYSDLNFLIPELVSSVRYRKGPYYAEQGNFSAAGSADIDYRSSLSGDSLTLDGGASSYRRGLLMSSTPFADGIALLALDYSHSDGPWELPEDFRKLSAVARYSQGDTNDGIRITAMGYDGRWRSTDQIPQRAIDSGRLGRFGNVDPSNGGESYRYSLSGAWQTGLAGGKARGNLYAIDYSLDLFSNFTYALDTGNGDQFEQSEKRHIRGGDIHWQRPLRLRARDAELSLGLELRQDEISPAGLHSTRERVRYRTIRQDRIRQTSYSAYLSGRVYWTEWLRTDLGLRTDRFSFDVQSDLAANSGYVSDRLASPKLTVVFGPWSKTELFLNAGYGFHSNDARGTTVRVDPNNGTTPVQSVDPLVQALGLEAGLRTAVLPQVQISLSLWQMRLDSELLFVGDAGSTEAAAASGRRGLEFAIFYSPLDWVTVDADLALARSRFRDTEPRLDRIPGAISQVVSLGISLQHPGGWHAGARLRHFGSAPLVEDGSIRAPGSTLVSVEVSRQLGTRTHFSLSVFNLFDRNVNDIAYLYESRLPGEAAPVQDLHVHPAIPRTLRASLRVDY